MYNTSTATLARPRSEKGAVAIMAALTLPILIGFTGLAVDGGRLYVTKTELQNAADACALAAANELTGQNPTRERNSAVNIGRTLALKHRVDFQSRYIQASNVAIDITTTPGRNADDDRDNDSGDHDGEDGDGRDGANNASGTSTATCTISNLNVPLYFMRVFGFNSTNVRAVAKASLVPSQSTCAIPVGMCATQTSSPYGFPATGATSVVGKWFQLRFATDSSGAISGYPLPATTSTERGRIIDFGNNGASSNCTNTTNSVEEAACLMRGAGQCGIASGTNGSARLVTNVRSGGTNGPDEFINAFNTRFGLYVPSATNKRATPPDFTGFTFSTGNTGNPVNWLPTNPAIQNAYAGASTNGEKSYKDQIDLASTVQSNQIPTQPPPAPATYSQPLQSDHRDFGANRRLVVMPIMTNCGSGASGASPVIRDYACMLMIDPYRKPPGGNGNVSINFEFLGFASAGTNACATGGVPGSSASLGARIPALTN